MTIEEMKKRKHDLGLTYAEIAKAADMPVGTVQKILGGFSPNPRRSSLNRIRRVLDDEAFGYVPPEYRLCETPISYGSSALFPDSLGTRGLLKGNYTRQGQYTLADYYALPDDQRVELIDGVLYDMGAPSSPHQLIGGQIYAQLLAHVQSKGGNCLPMMSPIDVQLDRDDRTMVEPDVVILCDRSQLTRRCIMGAPDFVVEVLSRFTRKKDMTIKMQKYASAGVREYWIIEPDQRKVVVYNLEKNEIPVIYSFRDQVPVSIWDGACKVDLSPLDDLLTDLYQMPGFDTEDERSIE